MFTTTFVLHEPSHPGNVGSAARALRNMGFGSLRLVAPKFDNVLRKQETIALASGALDVLEATTLHPTLESALADTHFSFALSARVRDFGPPLHTTRDLPKLAQQLQTSGHQHIAFVFGNERVGLPNEEVYRLNSLLTIPANPSYSSLNLAQAVQLIAFLWREAIDGFSVVNAQIVEPPATQADIAQLLQHWQQLLIEVDFLDPEAPKKLLPRLTRLLQRANPSSVEVNILRGFLRATQEKLQR